MSRADGGLCQATTIDLSLQPSRPGKTPKKSLEQKIDRFQVPRARQPMHTQHPSFALPCRSPPGQGCRTEGRGDALDRGRTASKAFGFWEYLEHHSNACTGPEKASHPPSWGLQHPAGCTAQCNATVGDKPRLVCSSSRGQVPPVAKEQQKLNPRTQGKDETSRTLKQTASVS